MVYDFQFKPDVEATEVALAFPISLDLSNIVLAKVFNDLVQDACMHVYVPMTLCMYCLTLSSNEIIIITTTSWSTCMCMYPVRSACLIVQRD